MLMIVIVMMMMVINGGGGGEGEEEEGNIYGKATLGKLYNVHNNNERVSWRQNIFDMKE